ncbi:hypothetical protein [Haliscomenobacter hydrossis]|uniref:Uncharacterized protein n=1 Tax=Haliscomenobacter hydrossis (strain ATCC 27775 / DSM 1100 / LMG 10767 / O) TaxID=760192 RepID=F4L051_HALH1|nr:hypothetical protein [Haliscomenobacter hydrossis]AEE52760.1 hypothetical protein Halhy_4932 [Haliscomenobacter hydrossis DSM 1100]
MIKITSQEQHEQIHCYDDEIILSGPPAKLRGSITLANNLAEAVMVTDLPIKSLSRQVIQQAGITINAPLSAGENRRQRLNLSLPTFTAPGTYQHKVFVGGQEKDLTLIVQETLEIELIPANLTFVGIAPGMKHKKEIILVNKGNVAFSIPVVRHNMTLDMDLICRNLTNALKKTPDGDSKATMDEFLKGLKNDLTDWVEVRIAEAGKVLEPGSSIVLHLEFTLPKDINPNREYEGDLRILDQLLSYIIVPGPKPTAKTPKKRA